MYYVLLYILKIIICIFAVFGVVVVFRAIVKRVVYEKGIRYAFPLVIPVDGDAESLEYIVRSKRDAIERGYYTRLIVLLPEEAVIPLAPICDKLLQEFAFVEFCTLETLEEHLP